MNKKVVILSVICVVLLGVAVAIAFIKFGPKSNVEGEKVTIKFDANGGEKVPDLITDKGAQILLPSTTRKGYMFEGWYYNGKEINSTFVYNEDITVKAKWSKVTKEVKTFTVTYDTKGGSAVSASTVECGKALTLPSNPTRDGYIFKGWEDKNGKSITSGVKFTCENVTLYAKWEKVEEKKTETPVTEPVKEKKYSCPSGYTLSGTKCTTEMAAKETCPSGTSTDGNLCIKTSDSNAGTRQCKEETVSIDGKGHTWTGRGDYHFVGNSYGKCAYYKWTSYTTKAQCEAANDTYHRTTWVSDLNGCYAEDKMNNYETVCASDYQYYTSAQLSSKFGIHNDARCLKKVSKVKYCDTDGYTLTNGKCVKTIGATVE